MFRSIVVATAVLSSTLPLIGQETALSLEDALERAQTSAPSITAARLRIEEARGRLLGASLIIPNNPTAEIELGRREDASDSEYGVEVAQDLQLPRVRRARIDAANAGVNQEIHRAREVERQILFDVASTYLRALEARELHEIAAGANRLATTAHEIAEQRYAAGDVAQLDVNLARTAMARSQADMLRASAMLSRELRELQILLGLSELPSVTGSLNDTSSFDLLHLLESAGDRADLRAIDAAIAEAEAEQRLAESLSWPEFGLRGSYGREEGDRIVTAGVGISLPLFDRGQQELAISTARLARLRHEREALVRSIESGIRGGFQSYSLLRDAASEYDSRVLPLVEANERLAVESYEAGQIGLADLLLVQREALDARRTSIENLIALRLEEVELRTTTGAWK